MYAHPCCVLFIFDLGKGVVVGGGGGAGAALVCNALVHVIHACNDVCAMHAHRVRIKLYACLHTCTFPYILCIWILHVMCQF